MKMLTSPSQALGEGPSSLRTETDVGSVCGSETLGVSGTS